MQMRPGESFIDDQPAGNSGFKGVFSLKVQPRHLITVEPFSDPALDLCHDRRPLRSDNK